MNLFANIETLFVTFYYYTIYIYAAYMNFIIKKMLFVFQSDKIIDRFSQIFDSIRLCPISIISLTINIKSLNFTSKTTSQLAPIVG